MDYRKSTEDSANISTLTKVAEIWKEILSLEKVGNDDDFFEIGGDSISAMRLFIRLRESFGFEADLALLFEASTIQDLTELILIGRESSKA